jgi:protein-S-isoprenylcysteine O-methyltransferase Ste14
VHRSGHHDEPRSFFSSSGEYAHLRHPQFVGIALVMFGFLVLPPTILALAMFPALVFMYARLARTEEREALAEFGPAYDCYRARAAAFAPRHGELLGSSRDRSTRRR